MGHEENLGTSSQNGDPQGPYLILEMSILWRQYTFQ